MKYLFVGYSKTGTKTIASAFKLLGFEVYDLEETMLFHAHQWIEIMDPKTSESEKRRIIYSMYKNIDVVTDHPANYYWELVREVFPECKFIFHEREVETWYKSVEATVLSYQQIYSFPDLITKPLRRFFIPTHYWANKASEKMCPFMYGNGDGFGMSFYFQKMPLDEFKMKRLYRAHNAMFLRSCDQDSDLKKKTLVLESYDDFCWEKICGWLDVKIPGNVPFPHENKEGEIVKKLLEGTNREGQVNLKNTCEAEFRSRCRLLFGAVVVGIFIFRNREDFFKVFHK